MIKVDTAAIRKMARFSSHDVSEEYFSVKLKVMMDSAATEIEELRAKLREGGMTKAEVEASKRYDWIKDVCRALRLEPRIVDTEDGGYSFQIVRFAEDCKNQDHYVYKDGIETLEELNGVIEGIDIQTGTYCMRLANMCGFSLKLRRMFHERDDTSEPLRTDRCAYTLSRVHKRVVEEAEMMKAAGFVTDGEAQVSCHFIDWKFGGWEKNEKEAEGKA